MDLYKKRKKRKNREWARKRRKRARARGDWPKLFGESEVAVDFMRHRSMEARGKESLEFQTLLLQCTLYFCVLS